VLRLRKKLGPMGERIETVWGIGYRFARSTTE
jgi:DNA-binding response OmpR family regulator